MVFKGEYMPSLLLFAANAFATCPSFTIHDLQTDADYTVANFVTINVPSEPPEFPSLLDIEVAPVTTDVNCPSVTLVTVQPAIEFDATGNPLVVPEVSVDVGSTAIPMGDGAIATCNGGWPTPIFDKIAPYVQSNCNGGLMDIVVTRPGCNGGWPSATVNTNQCNGGWPITGTTTVSVILDEDVNFDIRGNVGTMTIKVGTQLLTIPVNRSGPVVDH